MVRLILILLQTINSLFCLAPVSSQNVFKADNYPKGYFRNPLGIPIQLAANFGELRPNHFHMGLDIRTNQRENLPVYAAAEGYISKIKIEKSGFGRAIYINHPNGYTTLYAHLNDFYPALNNYVISKQYDDESWEQEFELEPDQLPVTKGQFIANSGNTGGSAGPHLHFEIRDTKTGNNLNPWLFGFGLPDVISPYIYRLYYYDRRYSTYQTKPFPVAITGGNGRYSTAANVVVLNSPYVSFGIAAEDKNIASSFRFGIYEASVSVDDTLRSAFTLNDISYNDTRYINGSIDYKTRASGGGYIQHLSQLPGNLSSIFSGTGNGVIQVKDTLVHNAEILVKDVKGNTSALKFRFRWDPARTEDLMFAMNAIPMTPQRTNEFKTDDLEVYFSPTAFYDTVPFTHSSQPTTDGRVVSAVHSLHNYTIPVHDSFRVRIRPTVPLDEAQKDKVVMQLVSNRKTEAVKGFWENDFHEAKFRDLGVVKLTLDTIPPKVVLSGWVNGSSVSGRKLITIAAKDNISDIKSFNAYCDGKWLLFSNKTDFYIHTFDNRTGPGWHELRVVVEDMAGNITEKNFSFTR
jgi:hypothetical protein